MREEVELKLVRHRPTRGYVQSLGALYGGMLCQVGVAQCALHLSVNEAGLVPAQAVLLAEAALGVVLPEAGVGSA